MTWLAASVVALSCALVVVGVRVSVCWWLPCGARGLGFQVPRAPRFLWRVGRSRPRCGLPMVRGRAFCLCVFFVCSVWARRSPPGCMRVACLGEAGFPLGWAVKGLVVSIIPALVSMRVLKRRGRWPGAGGCGRVSVVCGGAWAFFRLWRLFSLVRGPAGQAAGWARKFVVGACGFAACVLWFAVRASGAFSCACLPRCAFCACLAVCGPYSASGVGVVASVVRLCWSCVVFCCFLCAYRWAPWPCVAGALACVLARLVFGVRRTC